MMVELVPENPATPWDMHDPLPPPDWALPVIPFSPCHAEEEEDQVRGEGLCSSLVLNMRMAQGLGVPV